MEKNIIYIMLSLFIVSHYAMASDPNEFRSDTNIVETNGIVVTATRYPEKLIEIPLSVTVINLNELQNQRGFGIDEVLNRVPGVLAQSRSGATDARITIRGYGARGCGDRSNAGTSRGIKFYLDGIPETEPDGRTSFDDIDLSMASRIEVIRSNASAIWGNAAGGVVSISTAPYFKDHYINYSYGTGSYGYNKNFLGAATMAGNADIFSSFSSVVYDGFRQSSSGERYIGNIGLKSELGPGSSIGLFISGYSNKYLIPGPLTQAQFDSSPQSANPLYLARQERRYNRGGRIGVTFSHDIDSSNALSSMVFVNPKYLQRSERGTFRDFNRYHIGGSGSYRNIIKIGESIRNTSLLGFDESYQDGSILFYNLSPTDGRGDTLMQNKREGANSMGLYIQDEIAIGDNLNLLFGVRFDNITYYSDNFMESNLSQEKSFRHFTPKAGVSWVFSPLQSIFLNLGGGVEVPAGNETDPSPYNPGYLINPLLNPILSTTVEIGTKHLVPVEKGLLELISYDLALYWIGVTNDIVPYKGGQFYFTAGKSQRMGAELGANMISTFGLSLNAALTYSINKYGDYKVDSAYYGVPGAYADYDGNKIAGIPDLFFNVSLKYTFASFYNVFAELAAQGTGKYFADDANKYQVPDYTVFNATIGMDKPVKVFGQFHLSAFASFNNITDKKYAASAFINPDSDKLTKLPVYLEPGMPRNFLLGVKAGWQ